MTSGEKVAALTAAVMLLALFGIFYCWHRSRCKEVWADACLTCSESIGMYRDRVFPWDEPSLAGHRRATTEAANIAEWYAVAYQVPPSSKSRTVWERGGGRVMAFGIIADDYEGGWS